MIASTMHAIYILPVPAHTGFSMHAQRVIHQNQQEASMKYTSRSLTCDRPNLHRSRSCFARADRPSKLRGLGPAQGDQSAARDRIRPRRALTSGTPRSTRSSSSPPCPRRPPRTLHALATRPPSSRLRSSTSPPRSTAPPPCHGNG